MTEPSPYPAVDALIAKARAAMNTEPRTPGVADDAGAPAAEVTIGAAADGLVNAEVGPDGRVRSLSIDPAMFKRPLADVASAARAAINAALAARSADPDYTPVVDMIRDVQSQVRRDLGAVSSAMAEVAQQIRAARGGNA